jgi:predicted DNA-binding transcriptional regulator AlpA
MIKTRFERRRAVGNETNIQPNRHDRRHPDEPPEWMTKSQVAGYLQCSQRQVELLTKKGRIPKPIYLGDSSPRWRRSELLESLGVH